MPEGRRLAAVMVADTVGSRKGRRSADKATRGLGAQAEVVRPILSARQGRELRSRGDGLLAEFDSALRAVQCAIDLLQRFHERGAQRGATPIRLRIGVHFGSVEERGGDLVGDAVRIASRIEPFARPGGVCVSAPVLDEVQDDLPNRFEKVPARRLKRLGAPFDVFRIRMPWEPGGLSAPRSSSLRLAVLPFESEGADPKDDYFADALTQEVITAVSKIRGLRVIARGSVRGYGKDRKPLAQIGAELDVASILEGSVRRTLNRLRVTLQLIDVRSRDPLWETSYDRELADVFAIQAEIAERTAGALRLELVGFDRASVRRRPTSSLAAYDLYLEGIHAAHRSTVDGYTESLGYFEGAIRQDPKFALAHAHLANTLLILAGERIAPADVFPRVKQLVRRALELDFNSGEAHTARGNLALQQDQNWPVAEAEFRTALTLNPSDANAHYWYAVLLRALRRFDEAVRELETVLQLDPVWQLPKNVLIGTYHNAGDLGSAIALAAQEREHKPGDPVPHVWLGLTYAAAGHLDLARKEAALASGPIPENYRVRRALLLAQLGDPREARHLLRELEAAAGSRYVRPTVFASLRCALGHRKQALECLERDLREGRTLWLDYQGRAFDILRGSPRFKTFLRALNLPDEAGGARKG